MKHNLSRQVYYKEVELSIHAGGFLLLRQCAERVAFFEIQFSCFNFLFLTTGLKKSGGLFEMEEFRLLQSGEIPYINIGAGMSAHSNHLKLILLNRPLLQPFLYKQILLQGTQLESVSSTEIGAHVLEDSSWTSSGNFGE